jgi:virginiamycin B lyase
VTPAGTISTFAQNWYQPTDILAGPDGNLWFTNQITVGAGALGRMTPAGAVTIFTGSGLVSPGAPIAGPDGNIWFTDDGANAIGRINVTSGAISLFKNAAINDPQSLIKGPDGRLWFSSNGGNSIGRITTTGTVTGYASIPAGMVSAGPDGNIWVARTGSITKATTAGVVKGTFSDASIDTPGPLVTGSDGNLWFVNDPASGTASIGMVTLAGVVSNFTDPSIVGPSDLVAGPDGACGTSTRPCSGPWGVRTCPGRWAPSPPPAWSPATAIPASTGWPV